MLFSSFSFNTAKTGKIVTEDGSDRLAVLKESGESFSSNIISYAIILICFALQKLFTCVPDRLGYDNDFAWEEARYPGSRNGLTHFRRLGEK